MKTERYHPRNKALTHYPFCEKVNNSRKGHKVDGTI